MGFNSALASHFLFQCLHFLKIRDFVFESEIVFIALFHGNDFHKESNTDKYRKNRKNLISSTHKEIINSVEKYGKKETCDNVPDGIVPRNRMYMDKRNMP